MTNSSGNKDINIITYLKNNMVVAILVVIVVIVVIVAVVINLGDFAESIEKLSSIFQGESTQIDDKKWFDIQFEIKNTSNEAITISSLVEYYLTESQGIVIQQYPSGRVILNRFPSNLKQPLTIEAGKIGYFTFEFPKSKTYNDLHLRGSGNVHFIIVANGRDEPIFASIPFHKQYIGENKSLIIPIN